MMKDEEEAKEAAVNAQCNQKAVAKEPRPFDCLLCRWAFSLGYHIPQLLAQMLFPLKIALLALLIVFTVSFKKIVGHNSLKSIANA